MAAGAADPGASTLTIGVRADDARAASIETIQEWMEAARAGDEIHYCSDFIPRRAAGPRHVRALYDRGLVEIYGRRIDGVWHYIARRTRARDFVWIDELSTIAPATAAQLDAERLLEALRLAADRGQPCPANALLGRALGLGSGDRVSYLFKLLRRQGAIQVEPIAEEPKRRVTIVATGQSTGVHMERQAG